MFDTQPHPFAHDSRYMMEVECRKQLTDRMNSPCSPSVDGNVMASKSRKPITLSLSKPKSNFKLDNEEYLNSTMQDASPVQKSRAALGNLFSEAECASYLSSQEASKTTIFSFEVYKKKDRLPHTNFSQHVYVNYCKHLTTEDREVFHQQQKQFEQLVNSMKKDNCSSSRSVTRPVESTPLQTQKVCQILDCAILKRNNLLSKKNATIDFADATSPVIGEDSTMFEAQFGQAVSSPTEEEEVIADISTIDFREVPKTPCSPDHQQRGIVFSFESSTSTAPMQKKSSKKQLLTLKRQLALQGQDTSVV